MSSKSRESRTKIAMGLTSILLAVGLLSACGSVGDNQEASSPEASASVSAPANPSATASEAQEASEQPAHYPLAVTDELGHEVTIPAKPERVFAPVMEDSLLALGTMPVAVWSNGNQAHEYLQDKLADAQKVDFSGGIPAPETIMSLKPDLIVLHNAYYAENGVYEQYSKIAPTYVFQNAATDLTKSVGQLGRLLDKEGEAEKALADYRAKADAAKAKLAPVTEGKKAAIIRFNAKGMFFMNADYYSGYVLYQELGFAESELVKGGAFEVSLEILPDLDADYIFLVNDGNLGDAYLKELKESTLWQSVPAVREGRSYEVSGDHWLNGGIHAHGMVIDEVLGLLAP